MNFDLPDHLPPLLERMDAFTEGSEEMQMRRVAQRLFGFGRG